MAKFNPNKEKIELWATYIENRSPKFKIYQNKGLATSSLKSSSLYKDGFHYISDNSSLWKFNNKQWIEVGFKRVYKGRESLL